MMVVFVKLFATLRHLRPGLGIGEAFAVELPKGSTIGQLVTQLKLPEEEVKLVFVNGIVREWDYVLVAGDELGIFPPVGGG
jgi:sulfur-carrier protein